MYVCLCSPALDTGWRKSCAASRFPTLSPTPPCSISKLPTPQDCFSFSVLCRPSLRLLHTACRAPSWSSRLETGLDRRARPITTPPTACIRQPSPAITIATPPMASPHHSTRSSTRPKPIPIQSRGTTSIIVHMSGITRAAEQHSGGGLARSSCVFVTGGRPLLTASFAGALVSLTVTATDVCLHFFCCAEIFVKIITDIIVTLSTVEVSIIKLFVCWSGDGMFASVQPHIR